MLLAAATGTIVASVVMWWTARSGAWLSHASQGLILLASLAIPFLILTMLLNGILIGLGRVAHSAWLGVGGAAFSLLLVSAASVVPPPRLAAVVWAYTIAAVVQAVVLLGLVTTRVGTSLADPRPAIAGGLGYSLTSHASNVVHMLHLRADVFLVSLFLDPRDVGLYALAQAVCEWVWLVPRSASTVLFPVVAGYDPTHALAATTRTCRVVFAVAGLAALCLGVAASWLVPTVFGPAFRGSVLPIRLLLPGIWVGSVAGSLSAYLAGRGRPDLPLVTSLVSLALNIPLNLVLIPRHGIAGAAVASAITYSLMTMINVLLAGGVAEIRMVDVFFLKKRDCLEVWREIRIRRGVPWWGRA
jgi:O-antigen/teichoic acid export membrane protein